MKHSKFLLAMLVLNILIVSTTITPMNPSALKPHQNSINMLVHQLEHQSVKGEVNHQITKYLESPAPLTTTKLTENTNLETKIAPTLLDENQLNTREIKLVETPDGGKRIFIVFSGDQGELSDVLSIDSIKIRWIAPLAGGNLLISAILYGKNALYKLAQIRGVKYVSPDFYLYRLPETSLTTSNPLKYGSQESVLKMKIETPQINTVQDTIDAYKAVEIEGATKAWDLGYTGKNVTIAIVDTGVDYGVPNLNDSYLIYDNNVLAFVPDGDAVAITPYVFHPYEENGKYYIATAGKTFLMVDGFWGGTFLITFSEDFNVTNVKNENLNDEYHFGVFLEWLPTPTGWIMGFPVPILVTDHDNDGVYDRVYIDVTGVLYSYARVSGLPYDESWFDMKFEGPYYIDEANPEKALVSVDVYNVTLKNVSGTLVPVPGLSKDGYPDFSLGVIGVPFLDTIGVLSSVLSTFGITPSLQNQGLDPNGNWVGFMYDFYGHGTSCASTAAGRKVPFLFMFANDSTPRWLNISGIAPDANVMGVRALSWGYVTEGWLYAAGFDLQYSSTLDNQVWVYTGHHKADVISNSWGISWIWAEYGGYMFSYDVVSLVETSLSLPGKYWGVTSLADTEMGTFYTITNITNYEPSVFVHAEGNGGPGYGTANTGPWSPLAIQVAATTSWHFRPVYSIEKAGTSDQVIWWSNRGPTASGLAGPDVGAIGAYAFETVPLAAVGIGSMAWELFGGTSQATPMTAGAAAVVIQAAKTVFDWNPLMIKSFLMLGSKDLGYDVFTQGVGRIDVYNSVLLALNNTSVDVGYVSDTVFTFAALTIGYMGIYNATYNLSDVGLPFLFGGYLAPGSSSTYVLYPMQGLGDNDTVTSVSAMTLKLSDIKQVSLTLDPAKANYSAYGGYYFWFNTTKLGLDFKSHDFVRIIYHTPNWTSSEVSYIAAWLVNDTNGDGNVTRDEVELINRFTGLGPVSTVEIGYPSQFTETIAIGAFGYFSNVTELNFTILYYDYAPESNIVVNKPNGDHNIMNVTINVPSNALPGAYWAYIFVKTSDNVTIRIPVVYHVLAVVNTGESATYTSSFGVGESTYPNYSWIQGYDIYWRAEVGEWRVFFFETNASALVNVNVEWNDPGTDAYIQVYDLSSGLVMYEETPLYKYRGYFQDRDPTGNSTSVIFPAIGGTIYAVVIRAPVLSGEIDPVTFKLTFIVEPRVGPYVETLGFQPVYSLISGIMWHGLVASPEGLSSIQFLVNGTTTIEPYEFDMSGYNGIFMEVEATLYPDFLTEGIYNFSIVVTDVLGNSTWINYTIYVDRSSPLVKDVLVNSTSVMESIYGVLTSPENFTVTVKLIDVTPTDGYITIFDDYGGIYMEYTWTFDYTSGLFTYLDSGLQGTAKYYTTKGHWELTFTVNVSSDIIEEGVYYVMVVAYDELALYFGPTVEYTSLIVFDLSPPTVISSMLYDFTDTANISVDYITETVSNPWYRINLYDVELNYTSLTLNGNEVSDYSIVYVGDSTWQIDMPINVSMLTEGSNEIKLFANDSAGHSMTITFNVIYDISPPTGTLNVPNVVSGVVNVTFTYTDSASGVAGATLYLDGAYYMDVYGESMVEFDSTLVSDGLHTFTLSIVDFAGHMTNITSEFYVDNLYPTLSILVPINDSIIESSTINVTWMGSDLAGIDHYEVQLDNGDWINVALNTSYLFTGVTDGYHTIRVKAVDYAGHETVATLAVLVDTAAPTGSLELPDVTVNGTFTINITVNDANFKEASLYIDGAEVLHVTVPGTYTLKLNASSFADGTHDVKLVIKDLAGKDKTITGTFTTGYYAYMEAKAISAEKAAASANMMVIGVGSLIAGIIVGLVVVRFVRKP